MSRTSTALLGALGAALMAAGCGSDGGDAASAGANAARYDSPPERDIARVFDDLQEAARAGDGATVCSTVFSRRFADLVGERTGASCENVVAERFARKDASFVVRSVKVRGSKAVAVVVDRAKKPNAFVLVEQDGHWRIDSITNPAPG